MHHFAIALVFPSVHLGGWINIQLQVRAGIEDNSKIIYSMPL